MLTPRRHRGFEHLDDPATETAVRERSMRDVRVSNVLLGGTRAVLSELALVLPSLGNDVTLLDVGTGLADIPARAREHAAARSVRLRTIGLDGAESLARAAVRCVDHGLCGDVRALPLASGSVDVVVCSQLLHHFGDDDIPIVLRELDRVARRAVILSDLRRSWLAAGGFWMATWPLGFHPVTRHDGTTSVLRGFTAAELFAHVHRATGRDATVRRHLGYRLTASWTSSR